LGFKNIAIVKKIFLFFYGCLFTITIVAQKKNASYELHIYHIAEPVRIDGIAEKPVWKGAEVARDFFMVTPMDTSHAEVKTEVSMAYDKNNLYLLAICYNALPGPDIVESLRRDFDFQKNDNFILFMDPFEDQTNGFSFGTNAVGAQWDGLMYEGGKVDLNWDNKWTSVVKHYPDKWVLEMAIPFKSLRYKKGVTRWGINFSRNDLKTREKSSWAPVPRQFPTASLAYTGSLVWDEPPPVQGANVSLIPYILAGASKGYNPASPGAYKHEAGLDAKVAVTSSLNLDLTLNPDFSQVEVDKQVTNLDRYELFYPERRQFFLENGDQLNNFGYPSIRPFFSRRIGLGVPIEFGSRLSGKINRNWRITVMDMQTTKQENIGLPRQNFAVMAFQRRIFSRSNINILFINKQSINYHPEKDSTLPQYSIYNRDIGLEYNLASSNNFWTGKLLLLKSFSPTKKGDDWAHAGNLQYSGKRWLINGTYESMGKDYNAEVGYVPRRNYIKLNPQIAYIFFPQGGSILTHGPQINANYFFNKKFHQTDHENLLTYLITFRNKATLSSAIIYDYVQLLFPFDPTNSGKDSLQFGSKHRWKTIGADFVSKPQKLFTYDFSIRYGGYYADGKKFMVSSNFGYRFQPFLKLTLSSSYNELLLPEPWGRNTFWLIGPKIDLTMTNKLFFTTYVQYNEQLKNTNINARLQWRYKPASDLFIVYTDNYLNTPFSVRNRALLLKFTYWWNL
jgi:Domain of unknown function (DUF5916)/Carbohydrate family 9 binding domain-like